MFAERAEGGAQSTIIHVLIPPPPLHTVAPLHLCKLIKSHMVPLALIFFPTTPFSFSLLFPLHHCWTTLPSH
jgi:hypothetical protein